MWKMEKAIEKAIYYTDSDISLNPVITFNYNNEEEFRNIINNLSNNIEIIATFGTRDNFCYFIFEKISNMYETLLLNKTTSVCIINRKDIAIKLIRSDKNDEKNRIAILKLDAILAEYQPKSYISYFLYPLTFLLGGLITIPLISRYN
jgi:hypothetical protein